MNYFYFFVIPLRKVTFSFLYPSFSTFYYEFPILIFKYHLKHDQVEHLLKPLHTIASQKHRAPACTLRLLPRNHKSPCRAAQEKINDGQCIRGIYLEIIRSCDISQNAVIHELPVDVHVPREHHQYLQHFCCDSGTFQQYIKPVEDKQK